jgi:hypothetical protein
MSGNLYRLTRFSYQRQSNQRASFEIPINQGLAACHGTAMPEKRQGVSAIQVKCGKQSAVILPLPPLL